MSTLDRLARALGYVPAADVAAMSAFEVELRAVTTSEAERADLRECAILCGKLGMRAEDLPDVVSRGMRSKWRTIGPEDD